MPECCLTLLFLPCGRSCPGRGGFQGGHGKAYLQLGAMRGCAETPPWALRGVGVGWGALVGVSRTHYVAVGLAWGVQSCFNGCYSFASVLLLQSLCTLLQGHSFLCVCCKRLCCVRIHLPPFTDVMPQPRGRTLSCLPACEPPSTPNIPLFPSPISKHHIELGGRGHCRRVA